MLISHPSCRQGLLRQITLASTLGLLVACGGVSVGEQEEEGGGGGTGGGSGSGNSIPIANDDSVSTNTNTAVAIQPLANDIGLQNTPVILTITSSPSNGTISVSSYSVAYTPNTNFTGTDSLNYRVTDSDGEFSTATVTISVNPGGGGSGSSTPFANDDSVSTTMNTPLSVNVLSNDTGLDDTPVVVSILSSASQGSAVIGPNNTIDYSPGSNFAGSDSFIYKVTDADGDIATATVQVQVNCSSCAAGVTIDFAWDQNPDNVSGYEVYYAASAVATDATTLVSIIPVQANGFDATAPVISLDAWNDLGLYRGDSVCLRLKAYNSAGKSGYSTGVCGTVPG